jgi:hypothetical protein
VGCDVVGGGGCCGASGEFLGLGGRAKVVRMGTEGDSEATTKVSLAFVFLVRIKVHLPRSHQGYRVYHPSDP